MQKAALEAYTTFLEGLKEPGQQASGNKSTDVLDNTSEISTTTGSMRKSSVPRLSGDRSARTGSIRKDGGRQQEADENKSTSGSGGGTLYWRRMSKIADVVTWNLRILTGQAEILAITLSELNTWLRQARESGAATGLLITTSSPSAEDAIDKLDSSSSISDSSPLPEQPAADINRPTTLVATTTTDSISSPSPTTNITSPKLSSQRSSSRLILRPRSKI